MSYNEFEKEMQAQSFIQQDATYKQISNALAYQKDVEYMKQLLPNILKNIQMEIEDECDKLEYSGSVMFDEYPDKTHIGMIVDNILERLTTIDEGEVQGASLDLEVRPTYCEDDALADCEEEPIIEATDIKQDTPWGSFGWGGRPGKGHGRDDRHDRGHGRGDGPWGRPPHRPCFGPFCPITNRPCGGRWCSPFPFAEVDQDGNPNWMKLIVQNMLTNEMTYRRSRYRNRNI